MFCGYPGCYARRWRDWPCPKHHQEMTATGAQGDLRQRLLAAWLVIEPHATELISFGATAGDVSSASGHLKDLLMAIGLEWDSTKEAYTYDHARKK